MATKPVQTPPGENPKRIFESALALMKKGRGRAGAIALRSRPIAPQHSEAVIEKRAITDAARALAELWKISPHLVR